MTATRTDSEPSGPPVRREGWGVEILILIGAGALLFSWLGWSGLQHSEVRWAEITREMFLSGDFFHPTIGWESYFDKPVLTYWLVAGVSLLTGGVSEWAVRAPSALAGIVAVFATMWIGRRLWSVRTGRVAGAILMTTLGFLTWGRNAQADMENLAAIIAAVAWYWHRRERPVFSSFLGFYVIAFLGALTKGLPAVVVPVLAVLPDVLARRRWRRVLTPGHVLAALVGLLVYVAPFWYASATRPAGYAEGGLAMVYRENLLRFFQPFDHKGPVYLYLYYLPYLLLPWSPLFLAAVPGFFKIRKGMDDATRWLGWSVLIILTFFTLSGSRRGYYILPLLPFCALMIAVIFAHKREASVEPLRKWGLRAQAAMLGAIVLAELAAFTAWKLGVSGLALSLPGKTFLSMPAVAVASCILGYAGYRLAAGLTDGSVRTLAAMVGVCAGLAGGFVCFQQDTVAASRTERAFVLSLARKTKDVSPRDIGVFKEKGPVLIFYMNSSKPLTLLQDAGDLKGFLYGDGRRVLVTRRRFIDAARRAAGDLLQSPPDLVQETVPPDAQPSGADWVAWLNPGLKGDPGPPAGSARTAGED